MATEITSSTGNRSLTLWQGQDDQRKVKANTRIDAPPLFTSEEALLTQLEAEERFVMSGLTTGIRLSNQSGYSNDPQTAIAEWVAKFEEYCNGYQGTGHTINVDHRELTAINGAVQSLGWEYSEGAPYEVRWDMEFLRGQAMMSPEDTPEDSVSPQTFGYLDNQNIVLDNIESLRCEKQQNIEVYPVAFADPGENELLGKSGVVRRYTVIGTKENDTGDPDDERNQFDDDIRALMGQDLAVSFEEPFPGRTKTVMVDSYEGTREAGVTRLGKYAIELVEGVNQ